MIVPVTVCIVTLPPQAAADEAAAAAAAREVEDWGIAQVHPRRVLRSERLPCDAQ
jgi:hypothetical protein